MSLGEISWLGVLIAAILTSMLGAFWYSPAGFDPMRLRELGKTPEDLGSQGPRIAASVASNFVTAIAVALLVQGLGISSVVGGLGLGAVLAIGVVATAMLTDYMFSGWGTTLYAIQLGYRFTYLLLMGAILGYFGAR